MVSGVAGGNSPAVKSNREKAVKKPSSVGESRENALIREIKEELDAEIVIDRFYTTVNYNYPEFHLTMHCYLCHFLNDNYTLKEHLSARWLSADSLNTVQWLPADLNLVAELSQLMADMA